MAEDAASGLVAAGFWLHPPVVLSFGAEVGHTASRGTLTSAEISAFLLRVRYERDDDRSILRIGIGPRWLGSEGPWAWAATADWVRQQTFASGVPDDEGALGELHGMYRWRNHWLIGGQLTLATNGHAADGDEFAAHGQVALLVGATF